MKELKEPENLCDKQQSQMKALKKELQRKEKAMGEMTALLVLRKNWKVAALRSHKTDQHCSASKGAQADQRGLCRWCWRGRTL